MQETKVGQTNRLTGAKENYSPQSGAKKKNINKISHIPQ